MGRERVKLRIVGKRIKELREKVLYWEHSQYGDKEYHEAKKGITQQKFAEIIGVTLDTVKNWEQGYNYPSIDTLVQISNYFKCDFDYLMGAQDVPHKELAHISEYTGISNTAADVLYNSYKHGTNLYKIISEMLENYDIIEKISDCCSADYGSISQFIDIPDVLSRKTHSTLLSPKDIRRADKMQLYNSLCQFIDNQRQKNGLSTSDEL